MLGFVHAETKTLIRGCAVAYCTFKAADFEVWVDGSPATGRFLPQRWIAAELMEVGGEDNLLHPSPNCLEMVASVEKRCSEQFGIDLRLSKETRAFIEGVLQRRGV